MILTVDTGGTKTLVASFDARGKILKKHRFATPKNIDEYLDTLSHIINTEYDVKKIKKICIAVPGVVKQNQIVYTSNLPWKHFDLESLLRQRIATKVPIVLENDSSLAGLAEAHELDDTYDGVLYITISTGIGLSFITNGTFSKDHAISEGGHMMLEYDGILREWEDFASGQAIYQTYGRYAHDITSKRIWEAIADKVSRGLLVVIPIFRPEIIVIGGSIGTYFSHYSATLSAILDDRLPRDMTRPKLIQAVHSEEAVVYGCYLHVKD